MEYQSLIKWAGNTVTVYKEQLGDSGQRKTNGKNLKEDRKKAYKGKITKKTMRKTSENIRAWLNVINEGNKNRKGKKLQIVMITLTLSSKQDHEGIETDKYIKSKLLEPFLKWLRSEWNIVHYFWRAEPQANGNIHFHILCDRYIDKEKIQEKWNYLQNKYGLLRDYKKKYKKENPPSTHIRRFSGDSKSINYVCEYLTKNEGERLIQGLQMRFSNSVSKLKIMPAVIEKSKEIELIENLEKHAEWRVIDDYFMVFKFKIDANKLFRFSSMFDEPSKYYEIAYKLMYVLKYDYEFIMLLNLVFTNKFLARLYLQGLDCPVHKKESFRELMLSYSIYTFE